MQSNLNDVHLFDERLGNFVYTIQGFHFVILLGVSTLLASLDINDLLFGCYADVV